ncbi:MAG: S8 family serine peptidase [Verrucomicrobiales bacterium]
MNSPRLKAPARRVRIALVVALLLFCAGLIFFRPGSSPIRRESGVLVPNRVPDIAATPMAAVSEPTPAPLFKNKQEWLKAVQDSIRGLDPKTILPAGFFSHHKLQLALDELAAIEPNRGLICFRHDGAQKAADLSEEIQRQGRSAGRALFPVFYVKDAPRVAGSRRIMTGEIVVMLNPGITPDEIAREYELGYRTPPPESRLIHFLARSAFDAMEVVPRLIRDARVAVADHDLISFVQAKAITPNDQLFRDQWHLRNNPPANPLTVVDWDINIYPHRISLDATPVWGDFSIPTSGIRGRNIRIGLVDDGIDLTHPDLQGALADTHHAYDIEPQTPTAQVPFPPPRIVPGETFLASHQKYHNDAHGTNLAGLMAAVGNNTIGGIGVAPESEVVAIRALSWYEDDSGNVFQVPTWINNPERGDLVAPTADILFAAAYMYLFNNGAGFTSPGRVVYPGTPQQTQIPGFADPAFGNLIHIKNNSWGSPDVGIFGGPGPEVAGINVTGQPPQPGARRRAVEEGRGGRGTIFVNSAGNGRSVIVENANADGWANARETICVGALALPLNLHFDSTTTHHVGVYSEWGSCVMISAPGGGPYLFSRVVDPQRIYDGGATRGGLQSTSLLSTTDWTINEPANPELTPPQFDDLYGLNRGDSGDYPDPNYTQRASGTSTAAAIVSGVVALMLEANPRLSWLDVQNMLIRSATNHVLPSAYAADPTDATPVLNAFNGVDIADPQDATIIERDWKKNGGHLWFNHKYGAGMVSALGAVNMALTSPLFPARAEHTAHTVVNTVKKDLPEATADGTPATPPYEISFLSGASQNFIVTHATVTFDRIQTTYIGDIFVSLTSPSGMESILMEPHFDGADDLNNWTFSSVRHWGEPGNGTWKLKITDNLIFDGVTINPDTGNKVTLTLHGYSKPAMPVITNPESALQAEPTRIRYSTPGEPFFYTLTANNNPTIWNLALPPGLSLEAVPENNTYLQTQRIVGTPTAPGTFLVEVRAENAALYADRISPGTPPLPQPGASVPHYLEIEVPDCYTDWAVHFFGPDAKVPPGSARAAGAADPDADGFVNSIEFALGMNPTQQDAANAITMGTDDQGRWSFSYKRFNARANPALTVFSVYEFQTSSDLKEWRSVAISGPDRLPTREPFPNEYEAVEGVASATDPTEPCNSYFPVTVTQLVPDPARFFRLKITPYRGPTLNPLPPPLP